MSKAQKTLSIRVDADDYAFLSRLTAEKHENVSQAVRDLVEKGRLMLAIEEYQAGKASLGKAKNSSRARHAVLAAHAAPSAQRLRESWDARTNPHDPQRGGGRRALRGGCRGHDARAVTRLRHRSTSRRAPPAGPRRGQWGSSRPSSAVVGVRSR